MSDKKVLKPCPFCGDTNQALSYHGQPGVAVSITCVSCNAQGPVVDSYCATGRISGEEWNEAANKWNERKGEG